MVLDTGSSRTMPLGFPIVPEVYRMYSGSVAANRTASTDGADA